jgi:hypothetical protein
MFQNVEVEEEHVDERSVDDLLSFINGNDRGILSVSVLIFLYFILLFCRLIKLNVQYLIPNLCTFYLMLLVGQKKSLLNTKQYLLEVPIDNIVSSAGC